MPESEAPAKEEINLLTALKTAFSSDGDPHLFIARASDQIAQVEREMIETCSKNRIRVDDNLYALLESRDAIAERTQELDMATASASEITKNVNIAVSSLTERMRIRQNLDAALAVAAQTRKLTRMYARIEDTIDARRLYTAFRMLQMLEEETRCVQPGTILKELVPDCARLRAQIKHHCKKAFHAWVNAVRQFEEDIGSYALRHAAAQAISTQSEQDSLKLLSLQDGKGVVQIVSPPNLDPSAATPQLRAKPWTPMLTANIPAASSLARNRSSRSLSTPRVGIPTETNVRLNIGDDSRRGMRLLSSDLNEDVPMLYLRPLLQSVLVTDGLELMDELRSDYRRERQASLQRLLDEAKISGDRLSVEEDSPRASSSRTKQIESTVCRVVGFFVVERAVEMHTSCAVLARSVVDGEFWGYAYPRLKTILQEHDKGSLIGAADKLWLRGLAENVERFAQVNRLPS